MMWRSVTWIWLALLLAGCDQLRTVAEGGGDAAPSAPGAAPGPSPGQSETLTLTTLPERATDTVRICSFNIQVFGLSKEGKTPVMDVLAAIVREFDIVAIQEIRAIDQQLIDRFVARVNAPGRRYDRLLGPRLGRTTSKEQYAYVFDSERFVLDPRSVQTVDDPDDLLHRPPLIARFVFRGLPEGQGFSCTLINMHTDPDEAEAEVNVLDDVFLSARGDGRYEDDVILLGDLNVSERRLGQLGGVPGVICTVHGEPTNVTGTKSYDNMVFDPRATSEYTGRCGVLDFQTAFGLTLDQAKQVSDHRPVWAEFSVYERRASFVASRP